MFLPIAPSCRKSKVPGIEAIGIGYCKRDNHLCLKPVPAAVFPLQAVKRSELRGYLSQMMHPE